jgi:hypothetical protein
MDQFGVLHLMREKAAGCACIALGQICVFDVEKRGYLFHDFSIPPITCATQIAWPEDGEDLRPSHGRLAADVAPFVELTHSVASRIGRLGFDSRRNLGGCSRR